MRKLVPGVRVQRALRRETCRDGIRRNRKRAQCTVASGLDEIAAVRLDRVAQDRIVLRERLLHGCVLRLPQPRAALDVGEQERDRAGRQQAIGARHFHVWLEYPGNRILRAARRLRNRVSGHAFAARRARNFLSSTGTSANSPSRTKAPRVSVETSPERESMRPSVWPRLT